MKRRGARANGIRFQLLQQGIFFDNCVSFASNTRILVSSGHSGCFVFVHTQYTIAAAQLHHHQYCRAGPGAVRASTRHRPATHTGRSVSLFLKGHATFRRSCFKVQKLRNDHTSNGENFILRNQITVPIYFISLISYSVPICVSQTLELVSCSK
jgi:hypothetical protein